MLNSYQSLNRSDYGSIKHSFISKKIYKYDTNSFVSFFISLFLHLGVAAALISWQNAPAMNHAALPKNNDVAIKMNLTNFEMTKEPEVQTQTQTQKKQTQKKQTQKKQTQKIEKTVQTKKPIQKKETNPIKEKPVVPTKIEKKEQTQKSKTAKKPEMIEKTEPIEEAKPAKKAKVTETTKKTETAETTKKIEPTQQMQQTQQKPSDSVSADMLSHIRYLIQSALRYPPMARRLRIEGVVLVAFELKESGEIGGANIVKSSGNSSLDSRALSTVKELSGEYPRPKNSIDLQIPISFSIKNS